MEIIPGPVRTLAAILYYKLKNETGLKVSIVATLTVFGSQKKMLRQALKGVWYELGSQKGRQESVACDKQENESSSSEEGDDNDNDDNQEGVFAKIKLLRQKKHKK